MLFGERGHMRGVWHTTLSIFVEHKQYYLSTYALFEHLALYIRDIICEKHFLCNVLHAHSFALTNYTVAWKRCLYWSIIPPGSRTFAIAAAIFSLTVYSFHFRIRLLLFSVFIYIISYERCLSFFFSIHLIIPIRHKVQLFSSKIAGQYTQLIIANCLLYDLSYRSNGDRLMTHLTIWKLLCQ